ncbi:hypothetical protein SAMN05421805_1011293 [Saccharopolyspora antimicrobica]|uniref:Uncharacterized protein n=1 Tax=Saccharopolyspora antimicrobica TaxID=455193 RepID=A0A1I4T5J7_9PSEU|nr:hypothetical protein ATL45_4211 [Saccharopolyspora antimicrobica]SFM71949.1 hypothetical protein SAMN05421805_1011293 [Saccharopolyspora antimicrobica]
MIRLVRARECFVVLWHLKVLTGIYLGKCRPSGITWVSSGFSRY